MFKHGQCVYLPDGRRGKVIGYAGDKYIVKGIHIAKPFILSAEELKPRFRRKKDNNVNQI